MNIDGQPELTITDTPQAAKFDYETCWEDCVYCSDQLHHTPAKDPKARTVRLCTHPRMYGSKTWVSSGCCSGVVREHDPKPPASTPLKPNTPGWDDY